MYIKACPHNLGLQVKDNAAEKKFFGIPLLPLLPLFWLCGKKVLWNTTFTTFTTFLVMRKI